MILDQKGWKITKGSTSIEPVTSALETGAYALREVVFQMKKHGYKNITLCGDSRVIYYVLKKCQRGDQDVQISAIISY